MIIVETVVRAIEAEKVNLSTQLAQGNEETTDYICGALAALQWILKGNDVVKPSEYVLSSQVYTRKDFV